MLRSRRLRVLVVTLGALAIAAAPAAAHDDDDDDRGDRGHDRDRDRDIRVVAEGLNGPRQLSSVGDEKALVVEFDVNQVTLLDLDDRRKRTITGLPDVQEPLIQGATKADGRYVFVTGESSTGDAAGSSVYVVDRHGNPQLLANLLDYELAHNPDGQLQFDPETHEPLDALSNPYFVLEDKRRHGFVLVADAGGNTVYAVDRKGNVEPFFVPPVVNTGACEGAPNNDPEHAGCDPVPTGLAYGPNGTLYVSALTAEAPGEGRVYVLDAYSGKVKHVISGFTAPTGVEVDRRGNVYVSELLEGLPQGEPGPDFDPADVGQIVKVDRRGHRSYAQVTMPTGLLINDGDLYASAWSVAGLFLGMPDAGQVVRVDDDAFRKSRS